MKLFKVLLAAFLVLNLSSFVLPETEILNSEDRSKKNEKAEYRIQLCAYFESVPVQQVEMMRSIGGVSSRKQNGKSLYVTAPYSDQDEINKDLDKFRSMGFNEAQEVVIIDSELLTMDAFYAKYEDNSSDSDVPVVRIWK